MDNKKLICKIVAEEYPLKIIKSKARRAKYKFNKKGERVVSNPRVAGKPSYYIVNGQKFYSGFGSHFERMAVVNGLKDYYTAILRNVTPLALGDMPIKIKMDVHNIYGQKNWDLDNVSWLYIKVFQDSLVRSGIIEDDNITKITGVEYKFFPIKDSDKRKLVFSIYKDTRKELQNND